MKLPNIESAPRHHTQLANYVARRLRTGGQSAHAEAIKAAGKAIRAADRAEEDSLDPVSDALADRDALWEDFVSKAQAFRHTLAGVSLDAAKAPPYTLIFSEGIGWYTAARLEDRGDRMRTLASRVHDHMPERDSLRVQYLPVFQGHATDWPEALRTVADAEQASADASQRVKDAKVALRDLIERTRGALTNQLGKAPAERFFPKAARRTK